MRRKKYSRPAVESETVFEQTSLACTSTMFPYMDACDWGTNLQMTAVCETVPWKGGNFGGDIPCSVVPLSTECITALS